MNSKQKSSKAATVKANAQLASHQIENVKAVGRTVNPHQIAFINSVRDYDADNMLTAALANEVQEKLRDANMNHGRFGWHTSNVTDQQLQDQLAILIGKKDWLDAAIVAGMLHVRKALYA